MNAGELRSAELKVVDSKKNGIAYGIYYVRPDGMSAKMITPSHGDPYILVNTRGRIDNTTSSQIIHLDCRMKFDDIGYLMSYATVYFTCLKHFDKLLAQNYVLMRGSS